MAKRITKAQKIANAFNSYVLACIDQNVAAATAPNSYYSGTEYYYHRSREFRAVADLRELGIPVVAYDQYSLGQLRTIERYADKCWFSATKDQEPRA